MNIIKKNNRGITLVSLIVTVIILLILVGVTELVLPDGLFDKARKTETSTRDNIKDSQNDIDNIINALPIITE